MEIKLLKGSSKFVILGAILSLASSLAAESLTLTAYYPSPTGSYRTVSTSGGANFATNSGNVGIGTANPLYLLDVYKADDSIIAIRHANTTGNSIISFREGTTAQGVISVLGSAAATPNALGIGNLTSNGPILFYTNLAERMRITSSGDVGIGTTTPTSKLDVNGNLRINNTIFGTTAITSIRVPGDLEITIEDPDNPLQVSAFEIFKTGGSSILGLAETGLLSIKQGINIDTSALNPGTTGLKLVVDNGNDCTLVGTNGYIMTNAVNSTNLCMDDNEIMARSNGAASALYLNYEGGQVLIGCDNLFTDQGTYIRCVDIAEAYDAGEDMEPGDVVVLRKDKGLKLFKSSYPYDENIVGIYSAAPGILLGMENGRLSFGTGDTTKTKKLPEGKFPLALAGRVAVNISLENGHIAPGDPLTSSSKPGYAMKATKAGRVVGIALEGLDGTKSKESKVPILVNPHWWGGGANINTLAETLKNLSEENEGLKLRLDKLEKRLAER